MLGGDPGLVGAGEPALEQARDAVHAGEHGVGGQPGALDVERLVSERVRDRGRVGVQGITGHGRARRDGAVQEHPQVCCVDLVQDLQPAPAEPACLDLVGHHDRSLAWCATATLAACLDPADERFVDLDIA